MLTERRCPTCDPMSQRDDLRPYQMVRIGDQWNEVLQIRGAGVLFQQRDLEGREWGRIWFFPCTPEHRFETLQDAF